MPKLLHRQVFTHRGIYTKVLHTVRQMLLHTEAFEHRCLFTQKHLPRYALTYTRVYTQKLLDTGCFSENRRSFDTEKPLHRESFTHRSFYTQTPLHTEACTHGFFYAQKLLHRQAFTHKRFPTEKRFHRAAFTHFKKSQFYVSLDVRPSCEKAASGVGKLQLTLDNHFAWKGCAWPCKIAILHKFYFARNGCAWRFKIDKVAILHEFLNVCIWLTLKNLSFPSQLLPFDFHATLASELSKSRFYTSFWRLTLVSCEGAAPGHQICILAHVWMSDLRNLCKKLPVPKRNSRFETHDLRRRLLRPKKFRISPHHMFAHPTRTISAEGCPRTNKTRISPRVWVSDTPPPGCPCRQREIEELEKSDFARVQIQFDHLEVSWTPV